MKLSFLSLLMMLLPLVTAMVILALLFKSTAENSSLVSGYGFVIFFGWITALILGMTFKTLPFIIWNKCYCNFAGRISIPNPKDLFNQIIFTWMSIFYLAGFVLFSLGIFCQFQSLLQVAAFFLLASSILYTFNLLKLLLHKPVIV